MYKWISVVAIGSNIFSNRKLPDFNSCLFFGNYSLINRFSFDMASVSSKNMILYDYDWLPNMFVNDEFYKQCDYDSIDQLNTHVTVDELTTNENHESSLINKELNQYYLLTNEMPVIGTMNEIDSDSFSIEDEGKWKDKLRKHRKTSNFGFTSLQKRIERVKNDIITLTNKLNTGYVVNVKDVVTNEINSYYNLGFGNLMENEFPLSDDESNKESNEIIRDQKTWKCPSQFNYANPYSDLSENTQKILNRLHLNEDSFNEPSLTEEPLIQDNEDLEMEEDDIEFTFCTNQNSLIQSFINKGTLPIIEEEENENVSSSDEDTSSSIGVILDHNLKIDSEMSETQKTMSLQFIGFTESDSYSTALTSHEIQNGLLNNKLHSSLEDVEENFSDYARCSMSSDSSKESLNSYKIEKLDSETVNDITLINQEFNNDCVFTIQNTNDFSSSSMKVDDSSESDGEYDRSTYSNEDIIQSTEQSDSMYDKPLKQMIKSSLPDLIESSDSCDLNFQNYLLGQKNLNKSTDIDEILLQHHKESHQSPMSRLSLSLCNLNSAKSENIIYSKRFFEDSASQSNLLETDLDSGFVSIYQQVRETEIVPSVNFSSMINIGPDKSPAPSSLVERLRNKACSIPELRIADSLSKLNVPEWLQFRQDSDLEILPEVNDYKSYQTQSLNIPRNNKFQSSLRCTSTLTKQYKPIIKDPPIKPQIRTAIILPSEKLRQSSQKRLTPIKSCRARELLPNKNFIGKL